jgi:hypothetical protein
MADAKLKSSGINSGVAVLLTGCRVSYQTSNYVMNPDGPSNSPAYTVIPVQVDFMGRSNNKIIIEGKYDTDDPLSNGISLSLIKQFASRLTNDIYFTDDTFVPSGSDTGVLVQIVSWKVERDPSDSEIGHIVSYSIELVETK